VATAVEMPKLGNTVEDCLLGSWRKHKGDAVAAGEVIAEIETDKTSFELTAPVDGVLLETFFEEGALVPVFTVVCAIGSMGENVNDLRPKSLDAPSAPSVAVPSAEPPAAAASPAPSNSGAPPMESVRLSPRARRFAREHDFHPGPVDGTGPGGRILEGDLRRLMHSAPRSLSVSREPSEAAQAANAVGPGPTAQETAGLVSSTDRGTSAVRMSSMRQRIASRLKESLSSTAQYTLHSSANASGLLAVRKKMKASPLAEEVNINDLVVFCTVKALLQLPDLNAELVDGVLYRHASVHVGFACDTDRGLVVPVVRDAQDLSLLGLARHMRQLATQAVEGSIALDDLSGGTFTMSNLGSLGVEFFTPVLNPPQVAILGVNAIGLKLVRKPDGNVELIDSIGLSLTVDHQVVDGAPGARFFNVLRDKIEGAESLCTI
jgi:pyruvate dehydrogenase E2 component (dihydrolipoamide acetyltransferase)